ncbi:hypothetical protein JMF97_23175 [Micromonospora fiedleri]|uniref:Uncharacterized protein n=1 Tax=Micromonospora fiedleri TaxID=1157498 RepID=A0ABS1URU8_9ACTN|nr:hypothetical protein [Micromonospora fiedleri]MBL6279067.1 hypothetical protein [Micromonospora fiedleri]
MSLVTGETDGGILLIANDDTFAHTYPDLRRLLEEQSEGDPLRGAVEFFDFTGRRLVPGFDRQWCLTDLQPSSEPADPAAVQRRLQAVLDHLERFLKSDSESGGGSRVDGAATVRELPALDGTLADAIEKMPWHEPGKGTAGNFLHNAMHAAGWAH